MTRSLLAPISRPILYSLCSTLIGTCKNSAVYIIRQHVVGDQEKIMMEHLCCFCGEAWSAYDDSSGGSVSVKNVIYRMVTVDNELTTVTICHLHSRHQSKRLSFLLCFFCQMADISDSSTTQKHNDPFMILSLPTFKDHGRRDLCLYLIQSGNTGCDLLQGHIK
jgi:hypothetical protein